MKKSTVIEHLKNPPCLIKEGFDCRKCGSRYLTISDCGWAVPEAQFIRKQLAERIKQITQGSKFAKDRAQITVLQEYNKLKTENYK